MIGRLRTEARDGGRGDLSEVLRNLLGWAARYRMRRPLPALSARPAHGSQRSAETTRS